MDKKSNKNIRIYKVGYVEQKSVKPLFLIINKANRYIKKINGNKYLTLVLTDKSKNEFKKYEKTWSEVENIIRSIKNNLDDYKTVGSHECILCVITGTFFYYFDDFHMGIHDDDEEETIFRLR